MSYEGELGDLNLIEKLVGLGKEEFTGAIRFENDGIIKIIYFKDGDVLSASTNDRTDSIDEILLRAGKVNRDHIKQALARRKESETLGDALLTLGFITRKELTWARRVQVLGIIRSIQSWGAGSYTIVADYLPKREEGTLFGLSQILLELIVTDPDRARFEQALDSGNVIFQRKPAFDSMFKLLGLNQDAEEIAAQINGMNTASDVAAASGKDTFNVFKLLYALEMLGMLERSTGGSATSPMVAEDEDRAAAASVFPAFSTTPEASELSADSAWGQEESSWDKAPEAYVPPPASSALFEEDTPRTYGTDEPDYPMMDLAGGVAPSATLGSLNHDEVRSAVAENLGLEPPVTSSGDRKKRRLPWVVLALLVLAGLGYGLFRWMTPAEEDVPPAFVKRAPHSSPAVPVAIASAPSMPAPGSASIGTVTMAPVGVAPNGTSATIATATAAHQPTTSSSAPLVAASPTIAPAPQPKEHAASARGNDATGAPKHPSRVITMVGTPATETGASSTTITDTQPAPRNGNPAKLIKGTPGHSATITNLGPGGATVPVGKSGKPAVRKAVPPVASAPARQEAAAASASTGSADSDRVKYDHMAQANAASAVAATPWTVQFELVCQTDSIRKALAAGGEVWFVPTSFRNQSCYRVFWGHFASKSEAAAAIGQIPASLRAGSSATVVRYAH